jgi:hypothetical protein
MDQSYTHGCFYLWLGPCWRHRTGLISLARNFTTSLTTNIWFEEEESLYEFYNAVSYGVYCFINEKWSLVEVKVIEKAV